MIEENPVFLRDKVRDVLLSEIMSESIVDALTPLLVDLAENHHPFDISEDNPMLRPTKVAELFDVSAATVKNWIREGNLVAYKINADSGRPEWRVQKSDMVAFARKRYTL